VYDSIMRLGNVPVVRFRAASELVVDGSLTTCGGVGGAEGLVRVDRVRTGKTRVQDGEHDRRGGIVWHTQGSGKSLTMVLIRKLRTDPQESRRMVLDLD
jgi:hypothetical protein